MSKTNETNQTRCLGAVDIYNADHRESGVRCRRGEGHEGPCSVETQYHGHPYTVVQWADGKKVVNVSDRLVRRSPTLEVVRRFSFERLPGGTVEVIEWDGHNIEHRQVLNRTAAALAFRKVVHLPINN